MLTKIKKNKRVKFFKKHLAGFFLILGIILLSFLVYLNIEIAIKRKNLEKKISLLQNEIKKIETEKEKYQQKLSEAGGWAYWEAELRENFGYKKKGEEVIGFVFPQSSEKNSSENEKENEIIKNIKVYLDGWKKTLQNIKNLLRF